MHGAVTDPFFNPTLQGWLRYRVEEILNVSIHHVDVAFPDQFIDFTQRLFRTAPRAKAVTGLLKLALKYRFNHQLQRRLHDAVFDHRDSQRALLAACFGTLAASYRLWPVLSFLKRSFEFFQIEFCPRRKLLNTLAIHSRRTGVALYFVPRRLKRLLAVHLVDQAKPFPSFDAVFQRRQHALTPHRGFHPRPLSCAGLCALSSPCGHYRRLAFALPLRVAHASTFLPPVPRRSFALCASRDCSPLRYHEGSDSCTAHLRRSSPRILRHTFLSFRLQPRGLPDHRFPPRQRDQRVSDFALESLARRSSPPNRVRYPTDRHFASGCSPPRLAAPPVPSASE